MIRNVITSLWIGNSLEGYQTLKDHFESNPSSNINLIHWNLKENKSKDGSDKQIDIILLDLYSEDKLKDEIQFEDYFDEYKNLPFLSFVKNPKESDFLRIIDDKQDEFFIEKNVDPKILTKTIQLIVENYQLKNHLNKHIKAEDILLERLTLEELVTSVSTRFVNIQSDCVDSEISNALGMVGKYLGVERCYLDKITKIKDIKGNEDFIIEDVFGWCSEGLLPHTEGFKNQSMNNYKWSLSNLLENKIIVINSVNDMPPEAQTEKELWLAQGARSILAIPLYQDNSLVGMMGFNSEQSEKVWTHEILNLLRMIGEIFINILHRKLNEETLRYTLSVEQLVTGISYRFINASNEQIDSEINHALKTLAQFIQVDRSYFSLISEDTLWIKKMYAWYTEQEAYGEYIKYRMDFLGPYHWTMDQLRKEDTVVVSRVADLPPEAEAEKILWISQGRQSVLILPVFESGNIVGYLGFDSQKKEKKWIETDILLLKLVGEIFINALIRKRTDEALFESEERYRSLFEAADDLILVVDDNYRVVAANPSVMRTKIYDETSNKTSNQGEILSLLEADWDLYSMLFQQVFESRKTCKFDRELSLPEGNRWYSVTLSPIKDSNDRVSAVTFIGRDITKRVEAEMSLRIHAKRLEILESISISLRQAETSTKMVGIVLEKTKEIVEADMGILYLAKNGNLESALTSNWSTIDNQEDPFLSQELIKQTYDSGEYKFIIVSHKGEFLDSEKRSYALLPLKTTDATVGLLLLGFSSSNQIPSDVKRMLVAISEMAGSALHRAMIIEGLERRVAGLTQELVALYDLTFLAQETMGMEDILELSLGKIQEAINCEAVCMHLIHENGTSLRLVAHRGIPREYAERIMVTPIEGVFSDAISDNRRELIIGDPATDQSIPVGLQMDEFNSYLGIPMRVKNQTLGLLSIFRVNQNYFGVEETTLLSAIADQLGVALENARLRKCAEEAAVLHERQRLARELHDSVTQLIYSVTLFANLSREILKRKKLQDLDNYLEDIQEIASQALKEMRLLLFELRPSILEQEGLVRALQFRLEAVEKRAGVLPELCVDQEINLPLPLQAEIYRIAIEALNNSLKHASAGSIKIHVSSNNDNVEMEVLDDGKGFVFCDLGEAGMGLSIMRHRAEKLGGSLEISSTPGKGTRVRLVLNKSAVLYPVEEKIL